MLQGSVFLVIIHAKPVVKQVVQNVLHVIRIILGVMCHLQGNANVLMVIIQKRKEKKFYKFLQFKDIMILGLRYALHAIALARPALDHFRIIVFLVNLLNLEHSVTEFVNVKMVISKMVLIALHAMFPVKNVLLQLLLIAWHVGIVKVAQTCKKIESSTLIIMDSVRAM
jgi:hypothetical protein